jgi:hypothetical protein
MKKTIKVGIAALCLIMGLAMGTQAQTKNERPALILSAGPEAGIPVGNWNDYYNWSLGGSVQADLAIIKKTLYVNLNAGYNNVFAKDIAGVNDLQLIPVKLGLRYYPVNKLNLYVQGQAGVTFITNSTSPFNDKSAAFVYSPQIGYLIHLSKGSYLDAGVKFEGNSKFVENGESSNLIGLRVAYAFGL